MEQKTTQLLHEELVKCEGVTEIVINPHERFNIVLDQQTYEFTGPARVLINQD
ncbi:BC1881 family protein [Viridibacillus arvi]|uniref:BC1881 family protein n=1 Tax=Viridibacillus arvi TaxID=263475 RepID=UPI00187B1781|nr:BC1881 family protein [Viridibacillus sp. JNUCC-6]QOV10907.1 BC1881 family protein [Viridibacillus sp. JNUCC-6]